MCLNLSIKSALSISSFHFFFIHLLLIFGCGILVLLILRDQVVHVWFSFGEFHFVHSFTSVPMEECLSSEHSSELFTNSLEHFLNSSWISEECNCHLETLRWDITYWGFYVVWNPLNKVRRILVLYIQHLLINLFCWHSSSEKSRSS